MLNRSSSGNMARFTPVLPLVFLISVASLSRADVLSSAYLQQLFTQGNYEQVAKGAGDALASGSVTDAAERYRLASLKAEALLNQRDANAATEAFNAAAK